MILSELALYYIHNPDGNRDLNDLERAKSYYGQALRQVYQAQLTQLQQYQLLFTRQDDLIQQDYYFYHPNRCLNRVRCALLRAYDVCFNHQNHNALPQNGLVHHELHYEWLFVHSIIEIALI